MLNRTSLRNVSSVVTSNSEAYREVVKNSESQSSQKFVRSESRRSESQKKSVDNFQFSKKNGQRYLGIDNLSPYIPNSDSYRNRTSSVTCQKVK
jgi:hypothetical protein